MTKKHKLTAELVSEKPKATKKDQLFGLLRRSGGATLSDMTGVTGWLPHTARAMLSGLRKKGFAITKEKVDGATRYSITAGPGA